MAHHEGAELRPHRDDHFPSLFGNFGQTNYGAAKLGLVGFMNTLKIEGAKNNIHTNAIALVALTRMTENLIPEEAGKNLGPELITPAVTFLCSDDALNGVVKKAAGGSFSVAAIVENTGANLGAEAKAEDVAAAWSQITTSPGEAAQHTARLRSVPHDGSPAGAGAGGGAWGERLALPGHAPAPHGDPSPGRNCFRARLRGPGVPLHLCGGLLWLSPLAVCQAGLYASLTP